MADPFTRPSMFPDAEEWKEQLEAMKEARRLEEEAQREKEARITPDDFTNSFQDRQIKGLAKRRWHLQAFWESSPLGRSTFATRSFDTHRRQCSVDIWRVVRSSSCTAPAASLKTEGP
eukprot:g22875.t1